MRIKRIDDTYNPHFSIHTFNEDVRSHIYIVNALRVCYGRRHCLYKIKQLNQLTDIVKRY